MVLSALPTQFTCCKTIHRVAIEWLTNRQGDVVFLTQKPGNTHACDKHNYKDFSSFAGIYSGDFAKD